MKCLHYLMFSLIVSFAHGLSQFAYSAERNDKPNVIFILTDDQGWGDAGFAGHPYAKTPNLDRLASQGTWFKQFYVAATVCSPSRTAFMTGRYPAQALIHGHIASHQQNVERSMPDWLDPTIPTITKTLKQAGYATGHFGKWHLGTGDKAPMPTEYGIDDHRTTTTVTGAPTWSDANEVASRHKSTQQIVDEAIRFVTEHKDEPFYLNVWTRLPHAVLGPSEQQLKEYRDLHPRANDPAFGTWMQRYLGKAKSLDDQMKVFCASLTDVDTQVGRLMAKLDELKLTEHTIVVYSSDNGPEDYRISNAANGGVGSTANLRARKRSMYEGGIRTFGLVRWPGHVPAGRIDNQNVIGAVDFMPTICKLTGVAAPSKATFDGEDVSDIWLGGTRARTRPLFWEWLFRVQGPEDGYMPPALAVRDGAWKLFVDHQGGRAELYNIAESPDESRDVAKDHPDIVKRMTELAMNWHQSLPASPARETLIKTGKSVDVINAERKQSQGAPTTKPSNNTPARTDRAKIFKSKDKNGDQRMSLEEYLDKFPDQAEGKKRFPTFDTNQDGVLTEEEFVTFGKAPTKK